MCHDSCSVPAPMVSQPQPHHSGECVSLSALSSEKQRQGKKGGEIVRERERDGKRETRGAGVVRKEEERVRARETDRTRGFARERHTFQRISRHKHVYRNRQCHYPLPPPWSLSPSRTTLASVCLSLLCEMGDRDKERVGGEV